MPADDHSLGGRIGEDMALLELQGQLPLKFGPDVYGTLRPTLKRHASSSDAPASGLPLVRTIAVLRPQCPSEAALPRPRR